MKNKKLIRKPIAQLFLAFVLTVSCVMPLAVLANGDDPQEGGRSRRSQPVTCSSSSYDLILFTVVVTSCSDGSRTISIQ